jgi:hypothetical protein
MKFLKYFLSILLFAFAIGANAQQLHQIEQSKIDSIYLPMTNVGTADGLLNFQPPSKWGVMAVNTPTVIVNTAVCTNTPRNRIVKDASGVSYFIDLRGCAIGLGNSSVTDTRLATPTIVNDSLVFSLLNVTTGVSTPNFAVVDNVVAQRKYNRTTIPKTLPYVAGALGTLPKVPIVGNGGTYEVWVRQNGLEVSASKYTVSAAGAISLTYGNTATTNGTMTADEYSVVWYSKY